MTACGTTQVFQDFMANVNCSPFREHLHLPLMIALDYAGRIFNAFNSVTVYRNRLC